MNFCCTPAQSRERKRRLRLAGAKQEVKDASPRSGDPSGTAALRSRFYKEVKLRWMIVERTVRKNIGGGDVLQPGLSTSASVAQRVQNWFAELLRQQLLGRGAWSATYVREAAEAAEARAQKFLPTAVRSSNRIDILQDLAYAELQGICDATTQQVTRAVSQGLLANASNYRIAQMVVDRVRKVGLARSRMWVEYVIIKTFSSTTLQCFRNAGIRQVGTVSETLPSNTLDMMFDAARKTPQKRHRKSGRFLKFTPIPSKTRVSKLIQHERRIRRETEGWGGVDVLTAGDDLVCPTCESISANGPYNIDRAESLIPAHPNCRCVFVPAGTVTDAYDPYQPRDEYGKWASVNGPLSALKQFLRFTADVGHVPAKLILEHGKSYKITEHTFSEDPGPQKMCYMNATLAAMHNPERTYVEGYVSVHGIPIAHAWTVDKQGHVFDNTIRGSEGKVGVYFGIPFKTTYLLAATLKNKYYGLLGSRSKTLDEFIASPKQYIQDYDPNEKRDEHGRWTSGGAEQNLSPDEEYQAQWWVKENQNPGVREHVSKIVAELGYDPAKVYYEDTHETFEVAGKPYVSAGCAWTSNGGIRGGKVYEIGDITINARRQIDDTLVAHEVQHQKFQVAMDKYNADRDAIRIMEDPSSGNTRVLNADDTVKPEFKKDYPAFDKLHRFFTQDFQKLAKQDGITDYSKQYWKGWKEGSVSSWLAMHETMAEISAYFWNEDKRQKNEWDPSIDNRTYTQPPTPLWARFFKASDQVYDKVKGQSRQLAGSALTTTPPPKPIKMHPTPKTEPRVKQKKFDYTPTQKIRRVMANPSKPGTEAHRYWTHIITSSTVGDYLAKENTTKAKAYLKWFVARKKVFLHND